MNRRKFLVGAALAVLAGSALGALVESQKASYEAPLELDYIDKYGRRMIYKFHKGPKFTTLEEAYPYMEEYIPERIVHPDYITYSERDMDDYINTCNGHVILESITYGG